MQSVDNSNPIQNKVQSMKHSELDKLTTDEKHADNSTNFSEMTGTSSEKRAKGSLAETEILSVDPDQTASLITEWFLKTPELNHKNCLPKWQEVGPAPL